MAPAFDPGGADPGHRESGRFEDVNDDELTDPVSHYRTEETGITLGNTEECLAGEWLDGRPFEGCDEVWTVRS
jgi:hypothetical protein